MQFPYIELRDCLSQRIYRVSVLYKILYTFFIHEVIKKVHCISSGRNAQMLHILVLLLFNSQTINRANCYLLYIILRQFNKNVFQDTLIDVINVPYLLRLVHSVCFSVFRDPPPPHPDCATNRSRDSDGLIDRSWPWGEFWVWVRSGEGGGGIWFCKIGTYYRLLDQ
jgi:hypothetical protein